MSTATATTQIHPTAQIDPSSTLGVGVVLGPGVVVGPHCHIGDRTRLGPRAILIEHTTLGSDNIIHAGAILGDEPQDRSFNHAADPGKLVIGDHNIIREFVTMHRGAQDAGATRVGSNGYFMACAHIGHNCVVGDHVTFTNYAGLAGHVRVGDGCVLSSFAGVHQFCDVGEYTMFQAGAKVSKHVPPYCIVHRDSNILAGINVVGLRRSGHFSRDDITEIRTIYRLLFHSSSLLSKTLPALSSQSWRSPTRRLIEFIETALAQSPPRARGVCLGRAHSTRAAER